MKKAQNLMGAKRFTPHEAITNINVMAKNKGLFGALQGEIPAKLTQQWDTNSTKSLRKAYCLPKSTSRPILHISSKCWGANAANLTAELIADKTANLFNILNGPKEADHKMCQNML